MGFKGRNCWVQSRLEKWFNSCSCNKITKTWIQISRQNWNGTLPRNVNGSSSFCKGPRTSKVWKSKDPQGLRTLSLCMSEDLCKNYYSHLYFMVVTFLTKIQNCCYIPKKNLSKHNCQKSWMVKTTTVQKIWMGKTTTSKFQIQIP